MTTEELLPCPFCGHEHIWKYVASGPKCENCGATAESFENWNRRAPPGVGGRGDEQEIDDQDFLNWCNALIQQGDNEAVLVAEELKRRILATPPTDALAPQSGKKEEWISVKERLPEPGQYVLCVFPDLLYRMQHNGHGAYPEAAGFHVQQLVAADGMRWADCGVTHWMPLPSPPASKAEGEL